MVSRETGDGLRERDEIRYIIVSRETLKNELILCGNMRSCSEYVPRET